MTRLERSVLIFLLNQSRNSLNRKCVDRFIEMLTKEWYERHGNQQGLIEPK